MDDTQKTLHCSLKRCQAANPISNQFCSRCKTPLIKQYLWVVGNRLGRETIDHLIADRYLVISENLVLETQPGTPPYLPEQIPHWLKPYLKLSPYRLHIPKVYGKIPMEKSQSWLLEHENFATTIQKNFAQGTFLPSLREVWKGATGTRQLNWLLQISQLWQPLQAQGVAQTLVTPELVRVNGAIIQLQELPLDTQAVTLKDLGELWSTWLEDAAPKIKSFLQEVCQSLVTEQLKNSEGLVRFLEDGLMQVARSQTRFYQIATVSDPGPTRSHNEDAYYQQENDNHSSPTQEALAIVCDGVGGHQRGEVASQLAIDNLRKEIKGIQKAPANTRILTEKIEQAVAVANDFICEQNDTEKRQAQQRMGTTLVMAIAQDHQMYVTHVGDSRAYWITHYGCYQVTLDDDLASRQTRLGHLLYREALQQPSASALVQALGMTSSNLLHPNTQRLVIDEDCILLLCSDGLSDNGLVEQYWEREILPILEGEKDLTLAAQELINLANTLNGHDNVTVSLMKCSVSSSAEETLVTTFRDQTRLQDNEDRVVTAKQTPPPSTAKNKRGIVIFLLILAFVIGGTGLAYFSSPALRQSWEQFQQKLREQPTRDPSELPSPE